MGLNFGVLPNVLFKPQEAFKSLDASVADGVIMAAILTIVAGIVGSLATLSALNIMGLVVRPILAIIGVLLGGFLSAFIAKLLFKGSGNGAKTVGFLGYASVLGVIQAVVFLVLGVLGMGAMAGDAMMDPSATMGAVTGALGVAAIVGLVFFLWSLWIGGNAVASANGVSFWKGLISNIIAAFIVAFIVGIIAATLFVGMMGATVTGGMY